VSEKLKKTHRCELNVSYGSSEREKFDIISCDSTPQGITSSTSSFIQVYTDKQRTQGS